MRVGAVAAVLALAMVGCSADYVENDQSTVLLLVQEIGSEGAPGSPIQSDVRADDGTIFACKAEIGVTAILKNPGNPGGPVESVVLQRYDVSFVRSDGRAVEGVDVPYRFSAPMTVTVDPGEDVAFSIDLVRHQAKLEPPLNNIQGAQIVEMTANVTVWGQTVSRKTVSASGSAAIRFADFLGETVGCEYGGS